jgi:hypothetical protein
MKTNISFGDKALELLETACRQKANSSRTAWLLATGAMGLGSLLLVAVVDYWVLLSWPFRCGGALIILLLTGFGVVRLAGCLRRKTALKEAALDLEREYPEAGCVVSTATEYLSGTRKPDLAYEPELAAALEKRAAKLLATWQIPYWRRIRLPAVAFGVATLCVLAFLVVAAGAWTAFKRVATPWSGAAYTVVQVEPGDAQIPIGKDFAVHSSFSGRLPQEAAVHWRESGAKAWHQADLKVGESGTWDHALKEVRRSLEYYVTGGDGRSPTYHVEAYLPPEVKKLAIHLELPSYTGRPAQKVESPDIRVLRASMADFTIEPTVPLTKGRLRFAKGAPIELARAANGSWTGRLPIQKDDEYWIELFDQKNRLGSNDKPYSIRALPDEPPKVEISQPGQDIRADADQRVAIKLHASDDYGLREMRLVYNRLGQPSHTLPVKLPTDAPLLETPSETPMAEDVTTKGTGGAPALLLDADGSVELPLAELGLKDYELVAYHAEAVDNNTLDGPGMGKSPVYFIEITDEQGGVCRSQCNSAKVNLLVIQKQIIADTAASAEHAPVDQFRELADREKEATDFAGMYLSGLNQAGAPEAAKTEMKLAMQELAKGRNRLAEQKRADALPPEESALAHFYQVIKQLPELQDLPTKPPSGQGGGSQSQMLTVVLQAIKKQQKEQPDNKELADLARQLQQLSRSQANLAQSAQSLSQSAPNGSTRLGGSSETSQNGLRPASETEQAVTRPTESSNPETGALGEKQEQLSREAAALQEKLAKLAGHDHRLGHDIPKSMNTAAQKLGSASGALRQGYIRSGADYALEGSYALSTVTALLQRILSDGGAFADVSAEEFPKEYEKAIADYFKQLSRKE